MNMHIESRDTDHPPLEGALLCGQTVGGKFVLGPLVGAGSMGAVYEARQISSGVMVAIKILQRRFWKNEDLLRRFRREALSASLLTHPNSVRILDSQSDDSGGPPYLVMELLRGTNLADVMRHQFPLPLPRIVRILSQVLSAVGEAHARGIIHRDLKPGNIMLVNREGESDFVKVCDFGIAKMVDGPDRPWADTGPGTGQGSVWGTPEYMSPEQARAETLDGRSDLYSAAILLYQMVTGDVPFRAQSPMGVLSRQITERPLPPRFCRNGRSISPDLNTLILRGLAKDRSARFQTAEQFRNDLQRVSHQSGFPADTVPGSGIPDNGSDADRGPQERSQTTLVAGSSEDRWAAGRRATGNRRRWLLLAAGSMVALLLALAGPALKDSTPSPLSPGAPSPGATVPTNQTATEESRPSAAAPASRAALPPVHEPEIPTLSPRARLAKGSPSSFASVVAESDRLMVRGRTLEACAQLEATRSLRAAVPKVFKLLGQCYMRAGLTTKAKANYRRYLTLAPEAPDAIFVTDILDE